MVDIAFGLSVSVEARSSGLCVEDYERRSQGMASDYLKKELKECGDHLTRVCGGGVAAKLSGRFQVLAAETLGRNPGAGAIAQVFYLTAHVEGRQRTTP